MAPIKSSALSLLALRCPRCHEGPLFSHPAYSTSFADMPPDCPVCGQNYEPEPGFYYGAMFFSFGFSVGIFLACGLFLNYFAGDPPLWVYITAVTVATLVFMPLIYRYSRALMLYLFGSVHYDPNWAQDTRPQGLRRQS